MRIRSRRAVLARAQADVVQFEKRLHRLHPAVSDMPLQETPEQRQDRRSAIKTICRLSTALEHPDQLRPRCRRCDPGGARDAASGGRLACVGAYFKLGRSVILAPSSSFASGSGFAAEVLEGEELQILNDAVSMYERTVGKKFRGWTPPRAGAAFSGCARGRSGGPRGSSGNLRLHGQDVQLTLQPWPVEISDCQHRRLVCV